MSRSLDPRTANDRHLGQQWVLAGVPLALSLVALGAMMATGRDQWITFVAVSVTLSGLGAAIAFQISKIRRSLRATGPEAFVEVMLAQEKRVPKLRAQFRASAATGAALYGRPDLAEQYLASVRWDDEIPLTRAAEAAARALVHYCRGEWSEGFARARMASALSATDSRLPGAGTSALAFDMHVALGAALCDSTSPTTEETLERAQAELPLIGQLLAAWGLEVLAWRTGRPADAKRFAAFIAERAPHAALLTQMPDERPATR